MWTYFVFYKPNIKLVLGAQYALKRIGQYQEELYAVRSQQNTILSQMDSVREATGQIEQLNATTKGTTQLNKQQKLLLVLLRVLLI